MEREESTRNGAGGEAENEDGGGWMGGWGAKGGGKRKQRKNGVKNRKITSIFYGNPV
jgi:nitrate reductase beta subunit